MMEGRTYLASDLAGELGLPRSTITVSYTHLTLPTNSRV